MSHEGWPPCLLEWAGETGLGSIVDLERECFPRPWTIPQLRAAVMDTERGGVLILRSTPGTAPGLVAYCVLQIVLDELNVHTLAVASPWRRRGIGRWMLERALDLGARRGADAAFLEVRQSNWAALELYAGLGFEVISTRKDYYEGPREDAFVLRKDGLRTAGRRASSHP